MRACEFMMHANLCCATTPDQRTARRKAIAGERLRSSTACRSPADEQEMMKRLPDWVAVEQDDQPTAFASRRSVASEAVPV